MEKVWLELHESVRLGDLDASATPGFVGEESTARERTDAMRDRLVALQRRLYAEDRQSLLVVLQAMDTGGKDGAIRRVFSGINPNGVRVARFQAPGGDEAAHDYLWRVHAKAPMRGQIVIFNRSHYEDVLVVRVNELVPEPRWRKRFGHIRGFEQMLADEGTRILKFFLHIDRDEQKERLQARVDDPDKRWKFDPHDLLQRSRWADYMQAYEDAIRETSVPHAPWYIIPANRKWFRDYAIMSVLVKTLEEMDPQYPPPDGFDPAAVRID